MGAKHENEDFRVFRTEVLTETEIQRLSGCLVFEPDTNDAAIIGTVDNEKGEAILVYSYHRLVEIKMNEYSEDNLDLEDDAESLLELAADDIGYNTLRALNYMGPRAPLVLRPLEDFEPFDVEDEPPERIYRVAGREWC